MVLRSRPAVRRIRPHRAIRRDALHPGILDPPEEITATPRSLAVRDAESSVGRARSPEAVESLPAAPHLADDGAVMSHKTALAPAVRSEAAALYAVPDAASPPPAALLARVGRAGPAALDDHELLGLLGVDVDAATLTAAGGLRGLLDDPDDLLGTVFLSDEHRARVHAVLEVHARWMEARLRRDGGPLTSPAHTRRYIEARLRGYRNEVFACLFLDTRHRVVAFEELFAGTLDGRFRASARRRAQGARAQRRGDRLLPQCHPSGVAEPSRADRAITKRLAEALALVDVRLIDHFVVGDGECVSFAERGLL